MRVNKIAILYKSDPNLVPQDILPIHIEMIKQVLPDVRIMRGYNEADLLSHSRDADILLTWGGYKLTTFCRVAKNLKWIHALSAGVDALLTPEITESNIIVTSTKGIHGVPIANHTLAFIFSFLRQFPVLFRQQQRKEWVKPTSSEEVGGKTVGIVGLGNIGEEIAKKCKLLDMRVLAVKRTPIRSEWIDELYSPFELPTMLQESDFVIICIPYTHETDRLIGERELRLMKKTAYLINIARGGVVDQEALIKALREGAIAGAGLDVFENEPLPPDSAFWDLPNVIVTPHCAARSSDYMVRAIEVFCDNLQRYISNEKLLFEVEKTRGY